MRPGLLLLTLLGCHEAGTPRERGGTPSTGSPTTGLATGGSTSATAFDCSTIPDAPVGDAILEAPRAYNDIVFDADGALIGHAAEADAFLRATDPLTAEVHAPFSDTVYKLGLLSTGDIVAATSNGGLVRIGPSGAVDTVLNSLRGYGLAVHHTDQVYVATNYTSGVDGIVRVDPGNGDWEIVQELGQTPRAVAFSRDFDVLYIGTTDGGEVLALPLDEAGDPTGPPTVLATLPEAWHDTVEVDACGNVYVGSVFSTSVYRIRADRSIEVLLQWGGGFGGPYGHGFEWGDASGGWKEQAIYVAHPYIGSRVSEVELGVPGRAWPGVVVGGVTL